MEKEKEEEFNKTYVITSTDLFFNRTLIDLSNQRKKKNESDKFKNKNFLEFSMFEHSLFLIQNLAKVFTFDKHCSFLVEVMLKHLAENSDFFKHFSEYYSNVYQLKSEFLGMYALIFALLIFENKNKSENVEENEFFKRAEKELTRSIDYLKVSSDLKGYEEKFAEVEIIIPKMKKILKKFLCQEMMEKFEDLAVNCDLPILGLYVQKLKKIQIIKYEGIHNKSPIHENQDNSKSITPLTDKKNISKKVLNQNIFKKTENDNQSQLKNEVKMTLKKSNNTFSLNSQICAGNERKDFLFSYIKNNLKIDTQEKEPKKCMELKNEKIKKKESQNDKKIQIAKKNNKKERIIKKTIPRKIVSKKRILPENNIINLKKMKFIDYDKLFLNDNFTENKKQNFSDNTKINSYDESKFAISKIENDDGCINIDDWYDNIIAMRTPNKRP
jgi:hypothetical protein